DCRLFFFEVTDEQKRTYRKIANRTGCTIPDSLSSATHILVPPRSYFPHQLSQLKDAVERAVEVVTSEWLIECVQQQRNIDPELFAFNFPRDRNLRNSKAFGIQKKRDSSLDKEFEVPKHVLDEINPECDLSSMHNTRSFEGRNDDEVDDDTIQNDEQEEEEMLDFDCDNVCEENLQEEQAEDFNNVDAEDVEQEDLTQNVENGSAGEIEDQMQNAKDIEQEEQMQDVGEREDQTEAFNNGNLRNDVQEENVPRPSNVMDNNVDCLNLSMPINEYLRNDRPVKLHLPYDQLNAAISDDSELDSPTIDVLKLKSALAQMVQNIATPVGDAEPQSDSTVAQPKPLSPRKDSVFEAPLQPELMEISEASKDVEEIPQQITVTAPVPVITMEEEDSFNKTWPLEERSETSKDGEELLKDNTVDEEMPDEGTASGDGEL
uniref:BRCT domain-containing protein n=1 Tax=Panagrolaimus sp. ES5 TaxID=591445 RepID=A0AC34F376_9BILA